MEDFTNLSGNIHLGEWDFNVISLADMNNYASYIKESEYPANLWPSNFAFLWGVSQSNTRKILWKVVDGMLVTFSYLRSSDLYLNCLPFGKGGPDKLVAVVYKCLNYCYNWNSKVNSSTVVKVVTSQQLEFLKKSDNFYKYFKVTGLVGLEKHFSISKLISLSGKDFESIRRKLNKFRRLYPDAIIREYTDKDFDNAMKLGEYWAKTSGQKYSHIFDKVYYRELIKNCKKLNHIVLVVEFHGELIGLVSGGELPTGESWWCISKFKNEYDGLSEFLVIELAKEIHKKNPKIELMNAAEDMGPGGLRVYKERFKPVLDLRRYVLKLREK